MSLLAPEPGSKLSDAQKLGVARSDRGRVAESHSLIVIASRRIGAGLAVSATTPSGRRQTAGWLRRAPSRNELAMMRLNAVRRYIRPARTSTITMIRMRPNAAAGIIAPAAGIRPCRQCADQQKNKNNDQDRPEHGLLAPVQPRPATPAPEEVPGTKQTRMNRNQTNRNETKTGTNALEPDRALAWRRRYRRREQPRARRGVEVRRQHFAHARLISVEPGALV